MNSIEEIKAEMGDEWIPHIYQKRIRKERTRLYSLDIQNRRNEVSIHYTLLGIELKVYKKRFPCPDLSTARYIRTFARLGVSEFAIPYDISLIPGYADILESSWQMTLLLLNDSIQDRTENVQTRRRYALYSKLRTEIDEIGPGGKMPEFNSITK